MKRLIFSVLLSVLLFGCAPKVIDLSGEWRFCMDPSDEGISQKWFLQTFSDRISLPGSMLTNGKGYPVDLNTPWTGAIVDKSFFNDESYAKYRLSDNFKVPMWLQPEIYYKGVAWYQKDIDVPEEWNGTDVSLFLERCHWQTSVWVDSIYIGSSDALGTPQLFNWPEKYPIRGHHTITIRMDNAVHEINPGENAHSISDHTQGNWNGIVGAMFLRSRTFPYFERFDVYPSLADNSVTVKACFHSLLECDTKLLLKLGGESCSVPLKINKGCNVIEHTFQLEDKVKEWDEFSPNLYNMEYRMECGGDGGSVRFGFRDLKSVDGHLQINGHPLFLRGTLHCGTFPMTGYPSTDKQEWLRELKACKDCGLNHIRFHSWCPPEVAFEAADELGMYIHVECSCWTTIGNGGPIDDFVYAEAERIVRYYGNHPSFCLMAYGNEPGGNYNQYLADFVSYWKSKDSRRLYTSAGGWPNLPQNDFLCDPAPRIQGWGQGLGSILNSASPSTSYDWRNYTSKFNQPVVSHEVGQWCVYPDFKEIQKYSGPYKAHNFEIFRDRLEEHGMGELAEDFLFASGRLQTLCYKADIEAALRTPGFGGFQLLGINDFSGQGTALVGALNAFWEAKSYTSADEYRCFCSELVPLARMEKLVYLSGEQFHADLEVANFKSPVKDAEILWRLSEKSGNVLEQGILPSMDLPLGNCISVGSINYDLSGILAPCQLNLEVTVAGHSNDWNIWVYPEVNTGLTDGVLLTDNPQLADSCFKNGAKVILSYRKGTLPAELGGDIKVGFSSIFWNTAWTGGQPPHTLGILCDPSHPALSKFPTESYSDYQWADAMNHASAVRMDDYPITLRPIVRIIDDWFTARPLCLVGEADPVGSGRLIVSGVDFFEEIDNRPEARQLLESLACYLQESTKPIR